MAGIESAMSGADVSAKLSFYESLFKNRYTEEDEGYRQAQKNAQRAKKVPVMSPWPPPRPDRGRGNKQRRYDDLDIGRHFGHNDGERYRGRHERGYHSFHRRDRPQFDSEDGVSEPRYFHHERSKSRSPPLNPPSFPATRYCHRSPPPNDPLGFSQDEDKGTIEDVGTELVPPPPTTNPLEHENPRDTAKPLAQEPSLVTNLLGFGDAPVKPPSDRDVMAILSTASNAPNTITAASLKLVKKDAAKPTKERKDHSKHAHHQTEHLLISHGRPQSTTVSILRDKLSQGKDMAVQHKGAFRPRKRRKVATVEDDDDGSDGEIDPVNVDDTSDTLGSTLLQSQTLLQQQHQKQQVTQGQSRISPFYQSPSSTVTCSKAFYSTPSPTPLIKHTSEPGHHTSLVREPVHTSLVREPVHQASEPVQLIVKFPLSWLSLRADSTLTTTLMNADTADCDPFVTQSSSDDYQYHHDINDTVSHSGDTSAPYIAQASDTKLVIRTTRGKLSSESSNAAILSPSDYITDQKVKKHKNKKKKKSRRKSLEKTPPIAEQSNIPLKIKITLPN